MSADLRETIDRYNEAWNAHDLDAIVAMHAPEMVFENHTAGELAVGDAVREHIAGIFAGWPDLRSRPAGSTFVRIWSSRSGRPAPPTPRSCAGATSSRRRRGSGSSGSAWT